MPTSFTEKIKMYNSFIFDKESSSVIKGVAVLLMIAFHLFAFPERNGNLIKCDFLGNSYTLALGVCVSIYVFLAGYANEIISKKYSATLQSQIYKSIKNLFFKFISIAIPILSLVYVLDLTSIPNYGSTCKIAEDLDNFTMCGENLIMNILLIKTTYCGEWWFLALYFELLLISIFIPRNSSKITDIIILLSLFQ